MVFHALTFARSRGRCWKPRPKAEIFNNSRGTWQTLMHWKTMFDRCYCINLTTMLKKNNKNGLALFLTSSQLPCWFLHALSISIKILVSGHGRLWRFFPTVSRFSQVYIIFINIFIQSRLLCHFFTISESANSCVNYFIDSFNCKLTLLLYWRSTALNLAYEKSKTYALMAREIPC